MKSSEEPVTFGEWVKQRRRSLDLTQSELADRTGCSVFALRKIESGERRPSKQLAGLLARSLEISTDETPQFLRIARGELNLERLSSPGVKFTAKEAATVSTSRLFVQPLDYLNPIVGREQELNTLGTLLADPACRLLTLTGVGGIGKTRLAVETAIRNLSTFPDGICFVSLAGVQNATYITPTLAEALGVTFQGRDDSLTQLYRFLQNKHILLVLDNAEHLPEGSRIYQGLLSHAPSLKLLVTSRERLNLHSEWVFEIQGLPTPQTSQNQDLVGYSSIQLFIQSARRADAKFTYSDADKPYIAQICRLLEGMPLGIELAASWVSFLSCQTIASEMERSLDFLKSSHKDIPERQRSLRAAFDYSWALLSEREQRTLSGLAIFHGGFEREEVAEVVDAPLEILQSLAAKSLLRRKGSSRYDLHEVIRQYAIEHLASVQERVLLLDRHSQAYVALLIRQSRLLKSSKQVEALQALRNEINNIRAAWRWAIDQNHFPISDDCIRGLGWFTDISGLMDDGIQMLERLVATLELDKSDLASQRMIGLSLSQLGLLYFRKGNFGYAVQLLENAVNILRPLNEPSLMRDALVFEGVIMHLNGEYDSSRKLLTEGYACATIGGDEWYAAYAVYGLGYVDALTGNYERGYRQMEQGIGIWRRLGDLSSTALGLNHISIIALKLGYSGLAKAYLEESIELCTKVDDRWGLGTAYRYLGLTSIHIGEPREARQYLGKSLAILTEMTSGWDLIRSNIYLAQTYLMEGDWQQARSIWSDAFQQALMVQSIPLALEALTGMASLELKLGNCEAALTYALFIQIQSECTQLTIEEAAHIAADAAEKLTPDRVQSMDEKSRSLTFEHLLNSI